MYIIEKLDGENMDIKNLITFIHVAELMSFTKAAELLGYSQSTVSFQIKQLEKELNTQLFERINHIVVLTERGKEVLQYAHQIHKLVLDLKEMNNENQIKGHITLAMADSLCNELISKSFVDFEKQNPFMTLKIITADTNEMFRLVNHNEVDAILTLDHHIYNMEYVIAREKREMVHFICGLECPLAKEEHLTIQHILSYPFILTEKGMSYRRIMDEKLAELSLEIQPVLEIGNTSLICELVKQNVGLSFLPDFVTEKAVKNQQLIRLNVDGFYVEVWKQLLYHRDKWISKQLERVIQYCIEREF